MGAIAAVPDARLELSDGRTLGYAQWGAPWGVPVMLLHGAPGSRLFVPNLAVTAACGIRLVTADRPGYGRSDPRPGRTILDWASDVAELADALGLERFVLVGHSAGGPYALACGVRLADRLSALGLVSSVVPVDEVSAAAADLTTRERALVTLARDDVAGAAQRISAEAAWLVSDPELFVELPRPKADRLVLADKDAEQMYLATLKEAVRQGLHAFGHEQALERRPWGFRLADVAVPVRIWHGGQDPYVPVRHAQELAARLPRATLSVDPGAGHGLVVQRWGDILRALTDPRSASGASAGTRVDPT